ncbi:MAG: tetratricopeptide repeat protein [Gemmatimonadota bacterium]|nr:MAG: tetratricopeptide repeat protein [Gemmatimonadota bacterium]
MRLFSRYFVPIILICVTALTVSHCRKRNSQQKIKLDSITLRQSKDSSGLATTLQIRPESRRSIAIFRFENITGDRELDWMRRGLTQMLITDLSQFRYLDVLSEEDLADIMERMGIPEDRELDTQLAVAVAKEARLETALVGNFVKVGEAIRIDTHLYDALTGKLLKANSVRGEGLEEVFTMVDELTQRLRDGLKPTLRETVEFDKDLADVTTKSVEAYRLLTEGTGRYESCLYEEAADYFERAVAADTTFATAYWRLALTYTNLHRHEDARKALARAVGLVDQISERERLYIMALDADFKSDPIEMVKIYEQMVRRFPNDKEAHYRLGRNYSKLRRFDEAIAHFETALEIDHTYKLVLTQLGYSYWSQGMYDKAVETFRRYIETAPDEPNAYDSLGEIYQRAGRFNEAIREFKEALKREPDLYFPWHHMGDAYRDEGALDEAIKCYQRYTDLAPSDAIKTDGYRHVGEIHWIEGEYEKALEMFQKAMQAVPDNFFFVSLIAELYTDQGDTIGAKMFLEEWFESMGKKVTDDGVMNNLLGFVYACLENDLRIDELEPFVDRAQAVAPNPRSRAKCTSMRAAVRLEQGDTDSALNLWLEALSLPLIETRWGIEAEIMTIFSQAMADSSAARETIVTFHEKILDIAREINNPNIKATAEYLLFEYYERIGDGVSLERGLTTTGTPRESDWWIIGPFENKAEFHRRFPPEREIKLSKSYEGKGGRVRWVRAQDGTFDGYIDLRELMKPDTWGVTYGFLSLQSPSARRAQLRIGTDDATKVWLNGEEIWVRNERRTAVTDNDIIPVELEEGTNTILIKVYQTISGWGFFFRITDPAGNGLRDITFGPHVAS